MRLLRIAVALVILLLAVPVGAQEGPRRDPQAIAVLQQSFLAMGGPAIQDSVVEGTIRWADGRQGTIRQKSKGRDRLSNQILVDGEETRFTINRGQGYRHRDGRTQRLSSWMSRHQRPEIVPTLSRIADFVKPNMKIEYVGEENIEGRLAHHVRLSETPTDETPPHILELLTEFHLWIDSQTMLVTKTRSYIFSPEIIENRSAVETFYSMYQNAGGVLVPFNITRYVSGRKHNEIALTTVRWNVGLSDGDFQ